MEKGCIYTYYTWNPKKQPALKWDVWLKNDRFRCKDLEASNLIETTTYKWTFQVPAIYFDHQRCSRYEWCV